MQGLKETLHNFVTSLQTSKKRFLAVLFTLALLIGLPLSLVASQTEQQIAQHASGRNAFVLPTGSKLLFSVHVDNLLPNMPVVFYIITKDVNNREKDDPNHHLYTTDAKGNISFPVDPTDKVVINPLISKGYLAVTPDTLNIDVLLGRCGVSTPCEFSAHMAQAINGPVTPTPIQSGQTCTPRPACLDGKFKCEIAEPVNGWCPSGTPTLAITITPTPKLCPSLPQSCHYSSDGFCKVVNNTNVCACGEVICQQ